MLKLPLNWITCCHFGTTDTILEGKVVNILVHSPLFSKSQRVKGWNVVNGVIGLQEFIKNSSPFKFKSFNKNILDYP